MTPLPSSTIDKKVSIATVGLGNVVPMGFEYPTGPVDVDEVGCGSSLGGLLNHYYADQKAA